MLSARLVAMPISTVAGAARRHPMAALGIGAVIALVAHQAGYLKRDRLDHRRVEHDPGLEVQAQRRRVIGEPARRPQQVFARSRPSGAAVVITARANAAACGDTDDGRHRPI
jgi:hypothetical protein